MGIDRVGAQPAGFALGQIVAELREDEQRLLALPFFGNLAQAAIADRLHVSQMTVMCLGSWVSGELLASIDHRRQDRIDGRR